MARHGGRLRASGAGRDRGSVVAVGGPRRARPGTRTTAGGSASRLGPGTGRRQARACGGREQRGSQSTLPRPRIRPDGRTSVNSLRPHACRDLYGPAALRFPAAPESRAICTLVRLGIARQHAEAMVVNASAATRPALTPDTPPTVAVASGGTAARMAVWFGPMNRPLPAPMTDRRHATDSVHNAGAAAASALDVPNPRTADRNAARGPASSIQRPLGSPERPSGGPS